MCNRGASPVPGCGRARAGTLTSPSAGPALPPGPACTPWRGGARAGAAPSPPPCPREPHCPRQSHWPSHHSFCLSKFCPRDFKTVTTRRFETSRLSAACHGVAGSQSAGWGVPARVVGGASVLGEPRARLADPGVTCGSPQPPRRPGPARPLRGEVLSPQHRPCEQTPGASLDTRLPRSAGCRAVWAAEGRALWLGPTQSPRL